MKDKLALLEALFDNSKYFMWIKNEKGEYIVINDEFLKNFKKTRDEIIGKDDYFLFSKAEAEVYINQDKEILKTGEVLFIKDEPSELLGKHVVFKVPIYDKEGKIIATMGLSKLY